MLAMVCTGNAFLPWRFVRPQLKSAIVLTFAIFLQPALSALAADKEPPESQVKAAFLLNFPKYVEWPPPVFAANDSPIIVAFFGHSDVAEDFRKIIEGRTVNGHPLKFRQLENEEECGQTKMHMLFIAGSEHRRVPAILERLRHSSVLTVGETDNFMPSGGIINMTRRDRKIRLQINLTAARAARLKISSKLLSLAEVKEDPK